MLATFLFGVLGGAGAELSRWFRIREILHKGIPSHAKHPPYWIVTSLTIIVGGGLASIYHVSGITVEPIIAVNIGASAPVILGNFANQIPSLAPNSN